MDCFLVTGEKEVLSRYSEKYYGQEQSHPRSPLCLYSSSFSGTSTPFSTSFTLQNVQHIEQKGFSN